MKRQKSVTLFIEIVLALGIIVYTIILDAIVSNRLDTGLKSYFTSEIKEQSASFTAEFNEELDNLATSVLSSKNTYESMQKNGTNQKEIADTVCANLITLGADETAVFNTNGQIISSIQYNTSFGRNFVQSAVNGSGINDFVIENGAVYAVAAEPVKNNTTVVGVVIAKKNISVQKTVDKIKTATSSEATIFDEYCNAPRKMIKICI